MSLENIFMLIDDGSYQEIGEVNSMDITEEVVYTLPSLVHAEEVEASHPEFSCATCGKSFETRKSIVKHVKMHQRTSKKSVSCHICFKPFVGVNKRNLHVKRFHLGQGTASCPLCKKVLMGKKNLSRHFQFVHGNNVKFPCSICHKSFTLNSSLVLHMKSLHAGQSEWKCELCPKVFKGRTTLIVHKRAIHDVGETASDKQWQCNICGDSFNFQSRLQTHKQEIHSEFVCVTCRKLFDTNENLSQHRKEVHKYCPWQCSLCERVLSCRAKLTEHMNKVHDVGVRCSGRKDFQCNICQNSFNFKSHLTYHLDLVHRLKKKFQCDICHKLMTSKENLISHTKELHPDDIQTRLCPLCNEPVNSTFYEYKLHMKVRHSDQTNCELCKKSFNKNYEFIEHLICTHSEDSSRLYSCAKCEKKFKTRKSITGHVKNHLRPPSRTETQRPKQYFPCHVCFKPFTNKDQRNLHEKTFHLGQDTVSCPQCKKVLQSTESLRKHLKYVHGNNVKFPCSICHNSFTTNSTLVSHMKSFHEGRSEWKCELCPKVFKGRNTLNIHKRAIHDVGDTAGAKQWPCNICGDSFNFQSRLLTHKQEIHSEFVCSTCGTLFSSVANLSQHRKEVHKYHPWQCNMCERVLSCRAKLTEHMNKVHDVGVRCSGRKDFKCDICHNSFNFKLALTYHYEKAHKLKKKFQCNICLELAPSKEDVIAHIKELHPDDIRTRVCLLCNESVTSTSFEFRLHYGRVRHRGETYCRLCEKAFGTNFAFIEHMIRTHSEENRKLPCAHCGKIFDSAKQLRRHDTNFHSKNELKCEKCQKTFLGKHKLSNHLRNQHSSENATCQFCSKVFKSRANLQNHVYAMHQHKFTCYFCQATFPSKSEMTEHVNKHLFRPHSCKVCFKIFRSKHNLTHHMSIDHLQLKYTCGICKAAFGTENYLELHRLTAHSGNAHTSIVTKFPFICPFCAFESSDDASLGKHLRMIHRNEEAAKCRYCLKRIPSGDIFEEHVYLEHTDINAYKCVICDRYFSLQCELIGHLFAHGIVTMFRPREYDNTYKYSCVCGRKCVTKRSLRLHISRHFGIVVDRYKCGVCGGLYASMADLEHHMMGHLPDVGQN